MSPPVQGGLYVFQIYDHFSCSGASLLLLSIFQSLAIGWVYGMNPIIIIINQKISICNFL